MVPCAASTLHMEALPGNQMCTNAHLVVNWLFRLQMYTFKSGHQKAPCSVQMDHQVSPLKLLELASLRQRPQYLPSLESKGP